MSLLFIIFFIPKEVQLYYNNDIKNNLKLFECKSYEEMRNITSNCKELNIIVNEIVRLNQDKFFGGLYDEGFDN